MDKRERDFIRRQIWRVECWHLLLDRSPTELALETLAAVGAQRIAERDAKSDELIKRLDALEEQYRLALAQRFAPKSEKRRDRLFNEAEQIAETEPAEEDDDLPVLPDTGLPDTAPARGKRGRKPLPAHLPRARVE